MRSAKCEIHKKVFNTSLGWAGVAVSDKGVCRIVLPRKGRKTVEREVSNTECPRLELSRAGSMRDPAGKTGSSRNILKRSVSLLRDYFSGKRVLFDLPVDVRSFTSFQQAVWGAASAIPFGETRSYGWIAVRIKRPLAARAVGQAMGANPVPVIIP